ncbi:DNA translocase FtsK 4TM domain-containing protein [Phocaeicola massiliensis]|jgi:S-DNA-T family DNA segregation ATPase FtsK/SpoIIIE|uniref:FtsK/SpoIIIE family DNA translocase n=1 Tax=Phocaeicola massiliensis TaxID=204516 RepID=UPI00234E303E|nr:DNA translocase FtsK [Phocaeicola massiliensis]MDC7187460.1 DNA translocase FtsK 4TM domain-containing protein [Bacteroidaceae bacterium UO.H1004]MDC7198630.1 DNA translocase FtsK 4TM domain-containing protein [Phocaeicola massiliensis]
MAKKKTDKETEPKKISKNRFTTFFKSETTHFVIGLISVIFSVYLLLAFISFFFTGAADQSILDNQQPGELMQTTNHVKNYAGARGAQLAEFLINECFGIAACFIILFLAVAGMKMIKAYQFRVWKWFMSCSILLVWFSITLGFIFDGTFSDSFIYPGGLHGYNVSAWLVSQIGMPGLGLLLLITALLFFVYLSSETINMIRKALHPNFKRKKKDTATATDNENNDTSIKPKREEKKEYSNPQPAVVDFELEQPMKVEVGNKEEEVSNTPFPFEEKQTSEPQRPMPTEANEEEEDNDEPDFTVSDDTSEEDAEYKGPALQPYNPRLDLENYKFPTLDLLNQYEDNGPNIDMEEQNANKDRIIKVLRSFGIEISSIKASVGPTITLYEITPAEGVRISKIRNLEDDIALSLSALGIRIIAPIPGKGTIGIEVPNANPRIVPMQSILNSKKFQETTMELPIALGKTITNEVFMVDLAKAPHMLVAGATGQGKSVGLNAIVTSLLYKKHPAELKFVIVDPKKVEFSVYTPIERHFLAKLPDGEDAIITDVSKVVQTLNSLCIEMDTRYDLLRKAGCRNIKEYNAKFISRQLNPEKGHRFMPYIVIIIDEFGDLIMTAGKEVELPICRIAQLARAVGIHAIIATQRPTTNIITGTIKANFPARVAFRVAAMMDSRTILDRSGAQQLIGKGDMLYLQGNDPVRVQCAFVDTPEVERIANYISKQQGYPTAFMLPEYVGEESESSIGEVDMNRLDPMFEDAARLVVIHQQGSTSLIQRKFSIGYNRAGRIMDQLEKAGIVGPTQGSKARDVLCMDETDLEMKLNNLQQ